MGVIFYVFYRGSYFPRVLSCLRSSFPLCPPTTTIISSVPPSSGKSASMLLRSSYPLGPLSSDPLPILLPTVRPLPPLSYPLATSGRPHRCSCYPHVLLLARLSSHRFQIPLPSSSPRFILGIAFFAFWSLVYSVPLLKSAPPNPRAARAAPQHELNRKHVATAAPG